MTNKLALVDEDCFPHDNVDYQSDVEVASKAEAENYLRVIRQQEKNERIRFRLYVPSVDNDDDDEVEVVSDSKDNDSDVEVACKAEAENYLRVIQQEEENERIRFGFYVPSVDNDDDDEIEVVFDGKDNQIHTTNARSSKVSRFFTKIRTIFTKKAGNKKNKNKNYNSKMKVSSVSPPTTNKCYENNIRSNYVYTKEVSSVLSEYINDGSCWHLLY